MVEVSTGDSYWMDDNVGVNPEEVPQESPTARRVLATGILLMALAAAGYTLHERQSQASREEAVAATERSLAVIRSEVKRRVGLGDGPFSPAGWPAKVNEAWFGDRVLNNVLLPGIPGLCVEVATEEEAMLTHPPKTFVGDHESSAYWYNPYLGIVRARVPYQRTDGETLALYNDVNDCELTSLFPMLGGGSTRTAIVPDAWSR